MPLRIPLALGAAVLSMAACTTVVVEEPAPVTEPAADACNSAAYQQYVGQTSPAITLPAGAVYRHYRTGDPVTMDLRLDRLNFEYDRRGVLIRVSCG